MKKIMLEILNVRKEGKILRESIREYTIESETSFIEEGHRYTRRFERNETESKRHVQR